MNGAKKYLMIFGGSFALSGILILSMMAKCRCRKGLVESSDKGIHEKLRDSKVALDKAASLIQSALDDMERSVSCNGK